MSIACRTQACSGGGRQAPDRRLRYADAGPAWRHRAGQSRSAGTDRTARPPAHASVPTPDPPSRAGARDAFGDRHRTASTRRVLSDRGSTAAGHRVRQSWLDRRNGVGTVTRPAGQSVFKRSMPSDLIRGWRPVRVKKTRPIKNLARLRLRPTRRVAVVAPIAGSWRALVKP